MLALAMLALCAARAEDAGQAIAESAQRYLERRPRLADASCTGLTTAILADAGYSVSGRVQDFWDRAQAEGWTYRRRIPQPGDLAYFDNTWDANGNGRVDDKLSHIAVVLSVASDGTIEMVHLGGGGIESLRMNLYRPDRVLDEDGRVLNSYLAAPGYGPGDRRLAGQLWAGFSTVGDTPQPALAAAEPPSWIAAGDYAVSWTVEPIPGRRPRSRRHTADGARWRYRGRRQLPPGRSTEGRILRGRRVGRAALWGRSCSELWYLRNAVYARHGYRFVTPEAAAAFSAEPWYTEDPQVTEATADAYLTLRDERNVLRILDLEQQAGCRLSP